MDSCSRLIILLAATYVLFAKERQLSAAAREIGPGIQSGPSDMLYLNPNFEKNNTSSSGSENLNYEFITEPKEQQKAEPSFWREIEGQIFLAELLNLTKDQFNQFEPDQNTNKLDECRQFNMTIDETLKQINDLLELTTLERSYQMADLQHKNRVKSTARRINSPSPAKQHQIFQVFASLSEVIALFFKCLASIEAGDEKFKDQRYEDLHSDLLPLTDYMRKIGSLIENKQQQQQPKINDGLSFSEMLPGNNDFQQFNRLKGDKKHSSLIGKLNSAFDDLKPNMKQFVNENKYFLDDE